MEQLPKMNSSALLLFLIVLPIAAVSCATSASSSSVGNEQENDKVGPLPGQSFNLSYSHYSGYITVDEDAGKALFYWFFEAAEDPDSKPLVLWLNGGPGCSSVAYGVAEEIGPLHIKSDGKSLYPNPYSWNQVANIIFLDSPVGVGYSYSNNSQDVYNNGDESTAKDSLAFLKGWFKRFPKYQGREFYITGESYGGHYVPQLSQVIVRSQKSGEKLINLKGYMVGNALTDDFHDHYGVFEFMWASGLISDQTYKLLNIDCDLESFVHESSRCDKILDVADEELGNIDPYSIFTPSCPANITLSWNKLFKRLHAVGRLGEKYDPCTEKHSTVYFNLPEVKRALHVHSNILSSKWETCSDIVNEHWKDSQRSVLNIYHELIREGLRIWMFSGDTDAVIPVTATRYNINALKLRTVTPWHAWYVDGQVGGWTQVYDGLTYVTVRGAGHEVPLHRPQHALILFNSFITGSSMPTLTEVSSI